jgi:hypothetical protein
VEREGAHDAHDDALLLRRFRDALALVEKDLRLGLAVERDILRQDELSHMCLSPPSGFGVAFEEWSLRPAHPEVKT